MTTTTLNATTSRRLPLLPGALGLALALVAVLWAASYFRAEARVRRATARIVRLVQKEGAESPVALGLSANRLGDQLAPDAVLELDGSATLATERQEIVQIYVQIRNAFRTIEVADPRIVAVSQGAGEVHAFVDARYRFVAEGGEAFDGDGKATLRWIKGKDGWRIAHARLTPDPTVSVPKDWP